MANATLQALLRRAGLLCVGLLSGGIAYVGAAPQLAAQEIPQLDPSREIVCVERDDGVVMRMQCDETTRRCLIAEGQIAMEGDSGPAIVPRQLNPCSQAAPGAYARLQEGGYTMVPARHEAPFGYKRDETGRLFQTHFDLRRRYFVGVYDRGFADVLEDPTGVAQSIAFEVGGTYEEYDGYESRRSRFRFLEGELLLAPIEIEGLLFQYDRGRRADRPTLWLTTFIGEPKRFDINLDIGPGLRLGRFWYGPLVSAAQGADPGTPQMGWVDIGSGHVNWEMFQTSNLEDYFLVRVGAGLGVRFDGGNTAAEFYLFPEVGVEWAWLAGERGLTQLHLEASARLAHEPVKTRNWYELRAGLSVERILLAITDQPIALFVEPAVHVLEVPGIAARRFDARVTAGGRLSFFVPPREPDDQCPGEAEDFDGFQDEDGCFDPDNDADGIPDPRDRCPMEPEDMDGFEDEDGCPDY